jgi:hypothetical protein
LLLKDDSSRIATPCARFSTPSAHTFCAKHRRSHVWRGRSVCRRRLPAQVGCVLRSASRWGARARKCEEARNTAHRAQKKQTPLSAPPPHSRAHTAKSIRPLVDTEPAMRRPRCWQAVHSWGLRSARSPFHLLFLK